MQKNPVKEIDKERDGAPLRLPREGGYSQFELRTGTPLRLPRGGESIALVLRKPPLGEVWWGLFLPSGRFGGGRVP